MESKPKQKHLLFFFIPMGVYGYQTVDWPVDVRRLTMFGYVTKNNTWLSPGNHSFYRKLRDLLNILNFCHHYFQF